MCPHWQTTKSHGATTKTGCLKLNVAKPYHTIFLLVRCDRELCLKCYFTEHYDITAIQDIMFFGFFLINLVLFWICWTFWPPTHLCSLPPSESVRWSWMLGSPSPPLPPAPSSGLGWTPGWRVSAGSRLPCYSGATASPSPPPSLTQVGGSPVGRRGWGACLPPGTPERVLGRGCGPLAWESAALWGFLLMLFGSEPTAMRWSCLCSWPTSLSPCLSSHRPWSRDPRCSHPLVQLGPPRNHWHPPIHLHPPLHLRHFPLPRKVQRGDFSKQLIV